MADADDNMHQNPAITNYHYPINNPPKSYALSGKIMLSSIVILFAVVLFMVALHVYARWYLLRLRRRRNLHHRHRHRHRNRHLLPTHIIFYVDPDSATLAVPPAGLDPSVISTLPVFAYSSLTHANALECAVCLSEFEDNENGRLLPKCQHSFHTDCIDMWFQSHSTCPLCRSPVDPAAPNNQNDVVVSLGELRETDPVSGSTSVADRRKDSDPVGVTIEVPGRNELEDESRVNSPATPGSRSAGTRMMSLKRILSMNRKAIPAASPSAGIGTSCENAVTESESESESELEVGVDESTRAHTPR